MEYQVSKLLLVLYWKKKYLKIKLCWVNLTPVGVSLIITKLLHVAMLHAIV